MVGALLLLSENRSTAVKTAKVGNRLFAVHYMDEGKISELKVLQRAGMCTPGCSKKLNVAVQYN